MPDPGAGVWALFIEGASTGSLYKFEVLGVRRCVAAQGRPDGAVRRGCSAPASIVYESQYVWGDDDWMWYRGQKAMHAEPMSVYEVHVGSWRRGSPTSSWPTNWSSTSPGRATRM